MKNPIEMLKEIKNLLGVELSENVQEEIQEDPQVVLAQLKLENGTVLESNDFAQGDDVFILTEDEKVALPKGEYQLEDGRTLEVTQEGVIESIEVKAEEDDKEDDEEKELAKYPSKEEFDALKEMVMSMKEKMKAYDHKNKDDEKMKDEEIAELKEELAKPAVDPIKHNPEGSVEKKKKILYSQNRPQTTLDRVMQRISSIK